MLHGRARERKAVDTVLEGVHRSRGSALLIHGAPGVGKTSLLDELIGRQPQVQLLKATGTPAETGMPFAHLHQLLRPAVEHVDRLPPAQSAAIRGALGLTERHHPDRYALSLAVLNLAAELAAELPLLCIVDDLQWLDDESLKVLAFVARRIDREPIGMLLATTQPLGRATAPLGVPAITMDPLDRVASDDLVAERAGRAAAPEVRAALWESTGGNPLALIEAVDALTADQLEGRAPFADDVAQSTALHTALLSRVQRLPESTQTLLLLTAAEGTGDLGCVLRAAGSMAVDSSALEPAEVGAVIDVSGDRVTFCHPTMRTAVYEAAPFGRRQAAHAALAASLTDEHDLDRRTWHRAAAVLSPDDAVAGELEQVALRAAGRGGHSAASIAWERASDLSAGTPKAGRRMIAAADAAWTAGQPERCRALLPRAAPLATEPGARADLNRLHGLVESVTGDREVALHTLLGAAASIRDLDPDRATNILVEAGHIAWSDAQLAGMAEVARALRELDLAGKGPLAFSVQVMLGLGGVLTGDGADGIARLRSTVSTAADDDPMHLHIAGTAAMFVGDEHLAHDLLSRAIAQIRRAGMLARLPHTLSNLAALELWSGNASTARSLASEGAALADETGQTHHAASCLSLLAWLAALQGRREDCEQLGTEAVEIAAAHRIRRPLATATWARALNAVGEGRWDDALIPLESLATEGSPEFHPTVGLLSSGDLIETAYHLDQHDVAWTAVDKLEAFVERSGTTWAGAVAARSRALLSDEETAFDLFERAIADHAVSSRRYEEARTRLLYGELLRRARRKTDARTHLRRAMDAFERMGAAPWERRARAELRATGETARKREPSTLLQLTPQQLQIVRLVADGATNKEVAAQLFLSPRTVDYHLRNVFTKLGITSRADLIRLGDLASLEVGNREDP